VGQRGRRHLVPCADCFGRFQASYWNEGSVTLVRHVSKRLMLSLPLHRRDRPERELDDPRPAGRCSPTSLMGGWSQIQSALKTMQPTRRSFANHLLPALGSRRRLDHRSGFRSRECVATDRSEDGSRQFDVLRAISPTRSNRCPAAVTMSWCQAASGQARDRHSLTPATYENRRRTPEMYRPMVWIGAVLGLRWGEVAGLQSERWTSFKERSRWPLSLVATVD